MYTRSLRRSFYVHAPSRLHRCPRSLIGRVGVHQVCRRLLLLSSFCLLRMKGRNTKTSASALPSSTPSAPSVSAQYPPSFRAKRFDQDVAFRRNRTCRHPHPCLRFNTSFPYSPSPGLPSRTTSQTPTCTLQLTPIQSTTSETKERQAPAVRKINFGAIWLRSDELVKFCERESSDVEFKDALEAAGVVEGNVSVLTFYCLRII